MLNTRNQKENLDGILIRPENAMSRGNIYKAVLDES